MAESRIPSDLAAAFEGGFVVCPPLTPQKYRSVAEGQLDADWTRDDLVDSFLLLRESYMWRLIGFALGVMG